MSQLDKYLQECLDQKIFTAAQFAVISGGESLHIASYGDCDKDTLFDVASLTKIVCTTLITMMATDEGVISLEQGLLEVLEKQKTLDQKTVDLLKPLFEDKQEIKVKHLLRHDSGLLWHSPFYEDFLDRGTDFHNLSLIDQRREILKSVLSIPLDRPCEQERVYSDLGFILLGIFLELLYKKPLDQLFKLKAVNHIGMPVTCFNKANQLNPLLKYVPTEDCPVRKKVVLGQVHDLNCYSFGGIAGHAGLFSNIEDLSNYVKFLFNIGRDNGISSSYLAPFIFKKFLNEKPYPLGFDRPSGDNPACGKYFDYENTVGHLGYTGTSIWMDFSSLRGVVFLTNRVHPSAEDQRIRDVRPKVHDLAMEQFFKMNTG